MFIDKAAAVVAMLFGAFILAQPNPGMAAEPSAKLFNPQPDPPDSDVAKPAEFNPAPEPAPEPGVDKAMGVLPTPGARKGIVMGIKPGVGEVGMEFCCNPDDERSAKGIGNRPGGLSAAKGVTPPTNFGGAARKGVFPSENKPISPVMVPAGKGPPTVRPTGKALQGLKGLPVGQKMEVIPK